MLATPGDRVNYIMAIYTVFRTVSLSEIARELGVRAALLSRWKAEYLAGSPRGTAPKVPAETELKRLRQEVVRLRQERDFLKKAVGFFAQNED
jgi:transposase